MNCSRGPVDGTARVGLVSFHGAIGWTNEESTTVLTNLTSSR